MGKKKIKNMARFCPFSPDSGCFSGNSVCCFYREQSGCRLESMAEAIISLPNKLRRIEERLEEGRQGEIKR